MNFDALSLKHRVGLCRRAATAAAGRLRMLAQRVEPGDEPLRRLFENLAVDEENHLAEMGRFDAGIDPPPQGGIEEEDLDRIVYRFIPSLSITSGGRFIDREVGTYLAECLQVESARLYRALADQALDEESRAFFLHSKEAEESNIRFVRQVLL
jgi:rubrerythrin